jgi:hypothetical protein
LDVSFLAIKYFQGEKSLGICPPKMQSFEILQLFDGFWPSFAEEKTIEI